MKLTIEKKELLGALNIREIHEIREMAQNIPVRFKREVPMAVRVANRRRTCRPLSSRELGEQRQRVAWMLNKVGLTRPLSFREIRQVLNRSGPDVARNLVAKAQRRLAV